MPHDEFPVERRALVTVYNDGRIDTMPGLTVGGMMQVIRILQDTLEKTILSRPTPTEPALEPNERAISG